MRVYQKDPDETTREKDEQVEDCLVLQEAGAADRREQARQPYRVRAGRGDMCSRRAPPEGHLHAQGGTRRLHVHGIALQDRRIRTDHARRGGFFQRYGFFTGKEFVEFLKAACERFGKILMITDGAPQHRSKFVREEIGSLDDVELQFLPPGCPDLSAIEEAWRQMKHAILDVPYVRLSSMCSDIDRWLRSSLPKLDIKMYLYRKA